MDLRAALPTDRPGRRRGPVRAALGLPVGTLQQRVQRLRVLQQVQRQRVLLPHDQPDSASKPGLFRFGGPSPRESWNTGSPGVVVPGTIPSYSSGGSTGTAPSNVSPNNSIELEPAPSAKPGTSMGPTGSSGSGVGRSSYTTRRPTPAPATVMRSSRRIASTPVTTTGPRRNRRRTPPTRRQARATALRRITSSITCRRSGCPSEVTNSSALPPAPPSVPAAAKTGATASPRRRPGGRMPRRRRHSP